MPVVSMKNLLEAGVHFGHQTRRWNPKMKPYIFTERNGIYILDLQKTLRELDKAYRFVRDVTSQGGRVLFIGTKKQAQEPVQREAERSGQPYVNQRWLGGMLTNWVTIRKRLDRLGQLEAMETDGTMAQLPKKETLKLRAEAEKLRKNLSGIREMGSLPSAVFIVDPRREQIAIAEARRLRIPVVAIVDTNCDPDEVDYVIPGNDDAIRAVSLMCRVIADAAVEGRAKLEGPEVVAAETPEPKVTAAADAGAEEGEAEAAAEAVAAEPDTGAEPPAEDQPTESGPTDVDSAETDAESNIGEPV